MKRKKYLVNWFCGLTICMKDFLNYDFEELSFRTRKFDFINNYLKIILWRILWKLKKYDIVKYNTWEWILASKKYKWQILIWESHWFHFWLNFQDTIKHFKWLKKVVAYIIEFLLWPVIRYKIKKLDIYYVSTHNMLEFAKKIRPDAKRLPNSIDSTFTNKWPIIKLRWNPSIFWPTRLHSFKNPQFWYLK